MPAPQRVTLSEKNSAKKQSFSFWKTSISAAAPLKTSAWIYETDFEFLKQDDVVQIIVGGKRATDYLVRLLIAGIDRSRIVCCASETETVQHLQWDKFDKLMILYDLYNTESLSQIKKQLQEDAAI